MKNLAQMMRLYKAKLNLTNEEIATQTGLPTNTVARICSGRTKSPKLETLRKIAKVFDITIEELSGGEGDAVEPYYLDKKTAELALKIKNDSQYAVLLELTRELQKEDIDALVGIVKAIKRNR